MRALIIDDEPRIRRLLVLALAGKGWEIFEAGSGFEGIQEFMTNKPDIVLLDLNLPDMEGSEVLARLRAWSSVPIVVLSVRDSQDDIVALLNAGADDYIVKPFYTNELLARINAVCRRAVPLKSGIYNIDDIQIDLDARSVTRNGEALHLTATEFAILKILLQYQGKIVTRERLLKEVWGPAWEAEDGSLRVHILSLRRKLEKNPSSPSLIITEPGIGYRIQIQDGVAG